MHIDGTKITRILPEPESYRILDNCSEADCAEMVRAGWVLHLWYDGRQSHLPLVTYWATPWDFDVRLHGATVYKPYYMPPFDEEYNFYDE